MQKDCTKKGLTAADHAAEVQCSCWFTRTETHYSTEFACNSKATQANMQVTNEIIWLDDKITDVLCGI